MRRDYLSHRIFITFLVPLGFFGFLPCLVNEKTGLLYPCVAIHAANNSIAFCLLFAGLGLADCVGTGRDACACSFCLLACTAEQSRRRVAGQAISASLAAYKSHLIRTSSLGGFLYARSEVLVPHYISTVTSSLVAQL